MDDQTGVDVGDGRGVSTGEVRITAADMYASTQELREDVAGVRKDLAVLAEKIDGTNKLLMQRDENHEQRLVALETRASWTPAQLVMAFTALVALAVSLFNILQPASSG